MHKRLATVAQIAEFDAIIDVRSPAEFAEDRLPGARNCPVFSNLERAQVGTLYKQVSAFEARKLGAVLVARNIAHALEANFLAQPRNWRPLIYCWRGGQRSGAFAHVMREIGWDAHQLAGGYKTWRREVLGHLAILPERFNFRVISGATGSGKSRLLEALARRGAQVLHLEELAAHKGSVLGSLPGQPQPTQKGFDTQLFSALNRLDPTQPVYVEAESRKIGLVQLPESLLASIRRAPCLRIDASTEARVEFLLHDYAYALTDHAWLMSCIERLKGLQSGDTVEGWKQLAEVGDHRSLVRELLTLHYDPLYLRSQSRNFTEHHQAHGIKTCDLSAPALDSIAAEILSLNLPEGEAIPAVASHKAAE